MRYHTLHQRKQMYDYINDEMLKAEVGAMLSLGNNPDRIRIPVVAAHIRNPDLADHIPDHNLDCIYKDQKSGLSNY